MREEQIVALNERTQLRVKESENFIILTKWYRYEPVNTDSPLYNEWLPEQLSLTIPKEKWREVKACGDIFL